MEILTSEGDAVGTQRPTWQQQMRAAYRDLDELCLALQLDAEQVGGLVAPRGASHLHASLRDPALRDPALRDPALRDPAGSNPAGSDPADSTAADSTAAGPHAPLANSFPLFVPPRWLPKIERGNWRDPLLLQILPSVAERVQGTGDQVDPVGDGPATRSPGLIQKYAGRALLILTGACGIHCRYCFRRHFAYETAVIRPEHWQAALHEIQADASLREILLSGGDPLTLTDATLERFLLALDEVPHVRRLRFHSRMPVVIPERITARFEAFLARLQTQVILVIHANHPRELDDEVRDALRRLQRQGVLLFNQAVLLRGVNDSAETLVELSERLLEAGVTPYYLHQLDRVVGAAHFEVPLEEGRQLVEQLRQRLPGYAVPRFVQEVAGASAKVPVEQLPRH